MEQPLLLTMEEAGRLLGVGRSSAYSLARQGAIPVVHLGKAARVPRAAVEAYAERLIREAEALAGAR